MKRTKKRFSNFESGLFQDLGTGGQYSDVTTHQTYNADGTPVTSSGLGQNTSGSGVIGWGDIVTTGINALSSVATSIWGSNNAWQANAYNTMYQQEKRTNTVLWVIIGLIVALGVFLVIRKTK